MKKLLLTCGLAVVLATPAFAAPRDYDAARHVERLQEKLQLDDTQAVKVQSILGDAQTQRQALAEKYKISERDAFRKEVRALHQTTQGSIEAVLTDEQKTSLAALRAERKEKREAKGKHHHHRDRDHRDTPA